MKKNIPLLIVCSLFAMMSITNLQAQKALQAAITSSTNITCYGDSSGSATVTATHGTPPYTYFWQPIGGTNATAINLIAGTYTVIVNDSTSDTVYCYITISQPNALSLTLTSLTNVKCSYNDTGSASVAASGGVPPYTYLWMPGGSTNAYDSGMSIGTYTIMVTDSNGCASSLTIYINSLSNIAASTGVINASCFGFNNGAGTAAAAGGVTPYEYIWIPGGATTAAATGLSAGIYTVTITDALGCQIQDGATVGQPLPLVVTAQLIANTIHVITSGGTPAYTYTWSPNVSTTSLATGLSAGVYTITVNDSNFCYNMAIVTVPDISIGFVMPTGGDGQTCGNPSYFYFPIEVASDTLLRFNNCVVDIYMGGEFLGDSISNGGVLVTPGSQFAYIPGSNDYNILNVTNLSDTVIQIQFGSPADSSPHGTILPDYHLTFTADTLFFIKLRIQNSCINSFVNFTNTDTTAFLSDYTVKDTVSQIDTISATPGYTTCCPYWCYDSSCSCNTSCYDTTWTISYVIDTLSPSSSRNFSYNTADYAGGYNAQSICQAYIQTFNNPINAGTNAKSIPPNSSILNIKGWGLGGVQGKIQVCNSDAGFDGKGNEQMITLDSTDIIYWSENLIKVKMPSDLLYTNGAPGSGPFIVTSACGQVAASPYPNSDILQINYNIISTDTISVTGDTIEKLRPNIVMARRSQYDTASFIWHCDTSVSHNPKALACVKKALREWNCYTGINWKLGNDTAINDSLRNDSLANRVHNGVSIIYFSILSNFDSGTVMSTIPEYLTNYCYDAHDSVTFKDGSVIMMNPDTGLHISYDTTGIGYSPDSNYFYDNILHELGHALGLKHINDTLSLMYWFTADFRPTIVTSGPYFPGPGTLLGALDMVHTSVFPTNAPGLLPGSCPYIQLDSNRRCYFDPTLSVPIITKNGYNLNLYPNPINSGNLIITYDLTKNSSVEFNITDCTGRIIMKMDNGNRSPGNYDKQVNIDALAGGVYLFTSNINGELQVIKFIKL